MSNSLTILNSVGAFLRPVLAPLWFVFEIFCNVTDKIQQIFGVLILVGMWGLLMFNAIARWTDTLAIAWSFEITGYMVAWSICVMMGPITRSNEQIKVTFLPEKLLGEKRGASFLLVVENVIGLILYLYFTYHAYDLVKNTYDLHYTVESSGGWRYSMWYIRSGLLIGFAFTSLYYLERSIKWTIALFTGGEDVSYRSGTAVLTGNGAAEDTNATDQQPETKSTGINSDKETSDREQE